MTDVVNTEAGATGRFIDFGADPTNNDNLGAQTVICYCKPIGSGGGGFGYMLAKNAAAGAGPRFLVDHNSNAPRLTFGASSTGNIVQPFRTGTSNEVTYSSWQYYTATWDGTINATGIHHYVAGTESVYSDGIAGDTISSDTAQKLFLLNREGLGREFVGSIAWVARWNRVLNSTERSTARTSGPLDPSLSSGLVLCWANQQDYSSSALSPVDRSTHVDGDMPTNVGLGDPTPSNRKIIFLQSGLRW